MSRIQDILAKAERDGTTRRPQTYPSAVPDAIAPTHGTSALDPMLDRAPDPTPFMPDTRTSPAGASTAVIEPPAAAAPQTRTASATLHPSLVAAITPHSPVAEQYRAVRAKLSHREDHAPLRTLMVTSPGAGDGKSVTAGNLALTMAQEPQRTVVLVDADLRSPAVHALFGLPATPGLAQVLSGEATLEEALVYLPDFRLTVLPAGTAPQFPTELLGSNAMRRAMDSLRARFDRILLDVPAVAPLADAGTVGPLADGIVMVVRAGVTKRPALDQALAAFEPSQVVGIVLNETH